MLIILYVMLYFENKNTSSSNTVNGSNNNQSMYMIAASSSHLPFGLCTVVNQALNTLWKLFFTLNHLQNDGGWVLTLYTKSWQYYTLIGVGLNNQISNILVIIKLVTYQINEHTRIRDLKNIVNQRCFNSAEICVACCRFCVSLPFIYLHTSFSFCQLVAAERVWWIIWFPGLGTIARHRAFK